MVEATKSLTQGFRGNQISYTGCPMQPGDRGNQVSIQGGRGNQISYTGCSRQPDGRGNQVSIQGGRGNQAIEKELRMECVGWLSLFVRGYGCD